MNFKDCVKKDEKKVKENVSKSLISILFYVKIYVSMSLKLG